MKTAILSLTLAASLPALAQNQPAGGGRFQAIVAESARQTVSPGQLGTARPRPRRRAAGPERRAPILGRRNLPLTKGDDGAWVGDTRPQDEGFHYYQLVIDGAGVPDPGTLYFYGGSRWGSGVEVPAQDQDFYAVKDVPHGDLRQTLYYSKRCQGQSPLLRLHSAGL